MQGETKNNTAPNTSASQKMARRCALRRQQIRQRLRPCLRPPSSPRKGPSLVSAGLSALYKPLYNNTVQVVGKTKANTGSTTPAPVSHPLEKLFEEYIPDTAGQVHAPGLSLFKKNMMAHQPQDNTPTSLQLLQATKQAKQRHPTFGVKRRQRQIMAMHSKWNLKISNTKRLQKNMKKNGMTLPPSAKDNKDKDKNQSAGGSMIATKPKTITPYMYLSTRLIVPYFITVSGEIKRPEHLIAWWSRIFSFYVPDEKDRFELRFLCRLFRDSLKPLRLWTSFPHPKYPTLDGLMDKLNRVFGEDPNKAPKIVFVMNGTFHIPVTKNEYGHDENYVTIGYPIMIIGAGQDKTTIHGGFKIEGTKEEKKRVDMQGVTMKGSSGRGLYANKGLSFLCKDMTFTQCGESGVWAQNTKGRLINCVITQCRRSGIYCRYNALIELEGDQTKVDGNVICGNGTYYGLSTHDTSSIIHLLFPLTKKSVSTNNQGGNYGSCHGGTIQTVTTFAETEATNA